RLVGERIHGKKAHAGMHVQTMPPDQSIDKAVKPNEDVFLLSSFPLQVADGINQICAVVQGRKTEPGAGDQCVQQSQQPDLQVPQNPKGMFAASVGQGGVKVAEGDVVVDRFFDFF